MSNEVEQQNKPDRVQVINCLKLMAADQNTPPNERSVLIEAIILLAEDGGASMTKEQENGWKTGPREKDGFYQIIVAGGGVNPYVWGSLWTHTDGWDHKLSNACQRIVRWKELDEMPEDIKNAKVY